MEQPKTQKEKMLAGLPYFAGEKTLTAERLKAREVLFQFNNSAPKFIKQRKQQLKSLLGITGTNFYFEPPFRCDYGYNIEIGEHFYANFNLIILDCAKVSIGNNVFIAPNVGIYTAGHPIHPFLRDKEVEWAQPITIGNSVWIGAGAIINPGITIGNNVVIGSGSVVTKNIPDNVLAVGNPCRVIREITEADKDFYYKYLKMYDEKTI